MSSAELEAVAAAIRAKGGICTAVLLDVTDPSSIAALSGGIEVDILVNNTGIVRQATALDVTDQEWDAVIDTNLKGCSGWPERPPAQCVAKAGVPSSTSPRS